MAWSESLKRKVYNKFNGRCAYCGCGIKFKTFEIDHKFPKSKSIKDGLKLGVIIFSHNQIDNLMPSCHNCNKLKCDLLVEDFRKVLVTNKIIGNSFHYELNVK